MRYRGKGVNSGREDEDVEKEKICELVKNIEVTGFNLLFLLSRMIRKTNNLEIQQKLQTRTLFKIDLMSKWASESAKLEANPFVCDCFWEIAARPSLKPGEIIIVLCLRKSRCNYSERCKGASIAIVSSIYNPKIILSTSACKECLYLANKKC